MIHVAINGYGTIGRRVADAVMLQEDMNVVGISKTRPDYVAKIASRNYRIFVPDRKAIDIFSAAGISAAGTVDDMIQDCDIVVDATPEGMGETNLKKYKEAGVRAIFQGGEEAEIAEASFNAYSNFNSSVGKKYVRVVSCNTTGLARTLSTIRDKAGIESAYATLIRRATDQNDSTKGPINALEPSLSFPSHHGPDLVTVMPGLNVQTVAVKAPTTLMHVHVVNADLSRPASAEDIIAALSEKKRIIVSTGKDGKSSTAQVMDYAREMGRKRGDLFEIFVWKESIKVTGTRINFIQAVHQESDVVPENIDAIRAMFDLCDREDSISRTDSALRIGGE
ncbi:MAG: type II glyceraldehyde-3-phosphate dehydrogenase [Candidatus Thermoplasmatota archaeon]|nr:type II glyceraldehyde-3-phosphate dehydrogenase [Candidatus Thermoplasmatota archaeon]